MWNAERPRYLDIIFFRQDLRDCQDVFLGFSFGQGSCWKLVAGPDGHLLGYLGSLG